jgi:hypothetical protein
MDARRWGRVKGREPALEARYLLTRLTESGLAPFRTMLPSPLECRVSSEGSQVTPCLPTALGCSPDLTGLSEK